MALDETVGGSRRKKRPRSLRRGIGDSAADKARFPVQAQARDAVESVVTGKPAKPAAKKLLSLGLTDAEKRDIQSYSRARSQQVQAEIDPQEKIAGQLLGPNLAKLLPGGSPAGEAFDSPEWLALEAAGIFPFGRALRGGAQAAGKVGAKVAPEGADKIIESLPKAKKLRRAQEAGYTTERAKRAAKFEEALKAGGEEGWQAAMAELKGELPKLKLGDDLRDFDQGAAEELMRHIAEHDALRPFEKAATRRALQRLLEGTVPTRSEIKLIERTFGADLAAQIGESVSFWKKASNVGLSVVNVPRALMASFDLSAPFRQGLVLGARHPVMFGRAFAPMLKSFKSENAYLNVMDEIASRPTFKKMEEAKLQLTDFESLTTREEGFQSNLAEILTGGKRSPVRMSGRAYSAFLNKFRADAFDNYLRLADEAGVDIDDPRVLRSIASWVNHATGRGSIKSLEGAMAPLSALLFSPRLIASRLQLLNPLYYAQLDPFARKQALRGATQLLGGISLTLYLAKLAGAEVNLDARNSDFGKIKVGDTRVDIAGGLQQYVVNATRIIKRETVSSTTGEVKELEGGFGKPSRWSILGNFAENKLAPVPRFGMDFGKNENFAGEPFDLQREGSRLVLPIGGVSTYEAYQQSGPGPAAATAGLGGLGFGVMTYGSEPKKDGGRSLRSGGGKRKKSLRSGGRARSKSLRRH